MKSYSYRAGNRSSYPYKGRARLHKLYLRILQEPFEEKTTFSTPFSSDRRSRPKDLFLSHLEGVEIIKLFLFVLVVVLRKSTAITTKYSINQPLEPGTICAHAYLGKGLTNYLGVRRANFHWDRAIVIPLIRYCKGQQFHIGIQIYPKSFFQ
nr:hypothetical protein HmN_000211800 [Hymenolepis microstoma]